MTGQVKIINSNNTFRFVSESELFADGEAFPTNAVLDYHPDGNLFEMAQYLKDAKENYYKASWIFEEIEGVEYDYYNYDLKDAEIVEID